MIILTCIHQINSKIYYYYYNGLILPLYPVLCCLYIIIIFIILVVNATHPLVVLLLGDLLHLVQQLPNPQLQLRQLLLPRHVGVVHGVLSHQDVKVHALGECYTNIL